MKGVLIIPKFYEANWASGYSQVRGGDAWFWYKVRDIFGFELRYADEVDVDSDTDIVFMFGVPYHNRPRVVPGLLDLNKNTKLAMWPGDVQCYGNKECLDGKLKVFEACDLIICDTFAYFKKMYPQFMSKYEFMPKWFAPYERYAKLKFNENPIMKCLVSGHCYSNPAVYPRRISIIEKGGNSVVWGQPGYIGDDYANLLHSYYCCATSCTIFGYVVGKCYEIPAVGSLLLVEENEDLRKTGFIPYVHYVPIDYHDANKKIKDCLENPHEYNHIRRQGMEYVRKNHTLKHRMIQLGEIFDRLLGGRYEDMQ